jgi:hypothetical protein
VSYSPPNKPNKGNLEEKGYEHEERGKCEDERRSVLAWRIVSARPIDKLGA